MVRLKVPVPIEVTVVPPRMESDQRELARRVAEAHADFVLSTIDSLPCPAQQKQKLLQAVMDTVRGTCPASGLPFHEKKPGLPAADPL